MTRTLGSAADPIREHSSGRVLEERRLARTISKRQCRLSRGNGGGTVALGGVRSVRAGCGEALRDSGLPLNRFPKENERAASSGHHSWDS
jgi:hypothetical protein